MTMLTRLLLGSDHNIERRGMIWNMLGSFTYAFASMFLTILVVQVMGADEGGIFAFSFSTFGQHMFMAAYFGMRPFHITDTRGRFTFGEYLRLRFATCGGAVLFSVLYVLANASVYSFHKCVVVLLMALYKVLDAFADVYESEFQRDGRLYLTGKSNTFRTVFSVAVFTGTLLATRNLVTACAAGVLAQAAGILVLDIPLAPVIEGIKWEIRTGRTRSLFRENLVLFFSSVLDFYIFSAAKYAIDAQMADRFQALFSAIFMPTSVINLVAGFVIRPYVTKMAEYRMRREYESLTGVIRRLSAVIAGLTVLALVMARFLGIPVLSVLYPKLAGMLLPARPALMLIILGGAFNAFINLFYYVLIVLGRKRTIFCGYILTAVIAVLISRPAVAGFGILGGAAAYLALMAFLTVYLCVTALLRIRTERAETSHKEEKHD